MILVKEYFSERTGNTYELREFDLYKLYSPEEVKAGKASQARYDQAIKDDEVAAKKQTQEALTPKQLTEEQYFLQKKKESEALKAMQEEREAASQKALDDHHSYLQSSPAVAEIAANAFYSFAIELAHWASRSYVIGPATLNSTPSTYYACKLIAPELTK